MLNIQLLMEKYVNINKNNKKIEVVNDTSIFLFSLMFLNIVIK